MVLLLLQARGGAAAAAAAAGSMSPAARPAAGTAAAADCRRPWPPAPPHTRCSSSSSRPSRPARCPTTGTWRRPCCACTPTTPSRTAVLRSSSRGAARGDGSGVRFESQAAPQRMQFFLGQGVHLSWQLRGGSVDAFQVSSRGPDLWKVVWCCISSGAVASARSAALHALRFCRALRHGTRVLRGSQFWPRW